MENNSEREFLIHLITLIKENLDNIPSMSNADDLFNKGKALAYHEVSDFVLECSRIFNVELSDLGIDNFDPDKLL